MFLFSVTDKDSAKQGIQIPPLTVSVNDEVISKEIFAVLFSHGAAVHQKTERCYIFSRNALCMSISFRTTVLGIKKLLFLTFNRTLHASELSSLF